MLNVFSARAAYSFLTFATACQLKTPVLSFALVPGVSRGWLKIETYMQLHNSLRWLERTRR
jgi:hypothetical protein